MALAELLIACSVHPDERLLMALISASNAGNTYAVVDVGLKESDTQDEPAPLLEGPQSLDGARAEVTRILAAGGEPVIGLLPARPAWATEFGKVLDDLFDPCTNVAVASAKLSEFDYTCRSRGPQPSSPHRRACVLQKYGSSIALAGLPRAALLAVGDDASTSWGAAVPNVSFDALAAPGVFLRVAPTAPSGIFSKPAPQ
jgi:hypothetical protein